MAITQVIATSRGNAKSTDLNRSETHLLSIETSDASPTLIVHISPEKLNNAATIGGNNFSTDGGEIRTYNDTVAFFDDWTDIKTDI